MPFAGTMTDALSNAPADRAMQPAGRCAAGTPQVPGLPAHAAMPPATPRAAPPLPYAPLKRVRFTRGHGIMGLTPHVDRALEILNLLTPVRHLVREEARRRAENGDDVDAGILVEVFMGAGLAGSDGDGDEILD